MSRQSRSRSKSPVEKKDIHHYVTRERSRSRSRSESPREESPTTIQSRWEHYRQDHQEILNKYYTLDLKDQLNVLSALIFQALKKVYLHPVKFECVWSAIPITEDEFDEAFNFNKNLPFEPPYLGWHDLAFGPHITDLHMSASQTGNNDTRGGGCGALKIPLTEFSWHISNRRGITFQNLVEAVYRMKGSKFDNWYELFDRICNRNPSTRKEHEIFLRTKFDYGS